MAGYIGSKTSVVSSGVERKKTYSITGSTTSLTGLNYTVGKVHVYQNGVRLLDGTDYTATNGTSITLTVAAQSGDNVVVVSQASFQLSESYTSTESDARYVQPTHTGNVNITGTVTADGLTVDGDANLQNILNIGGSDPQIRTNTSDGSDNKTLWIGGGGVAYSWDRGGFFYAQGNEAGGHVGITAGNVSGGSIKFTTGASESMRIDASGRVGIGTSSPIEKITANGSVVSTASNSTGSTSGANRAILDFTSGGARIGHFRGTTAAGSGYASFYTDSTERMRIDSSGKVGIGTSNIYGDLHLQGGQQDIILTNLNADGVAGATISRFISQARGYSNNGAELASIDFETSASAWYKGDIVFKTNGSDGTNPAVNASERMRIDSSGAVTMPYQPAFMARKNAGQLNMPINVYNTVTFGNEVFDRNADYDGSTTFTAPITGVYQANIKVRIDQVDNQANYYLVRLQTSNRHYYTITDFDGSSSDPTYSTHSFSQLIDMDAGDTAYIQAYQSGGSVQSDYDNDSGASQFSMFLVA